MIFPFASLYLNFVTVFLQLSFIATHPRCIATWLSIQFLKKATIEIANLILSRKNKFTPRSFTKTIKKTEASFSDGEKAKKKHI